jgi:hypothetical protein
MQSDFGFWILAFWFQNRNLILYPRPYQMCSHVHGFIFEGQCASSLPIISFFLAIGVLTEVALSLKTAFRVLLVNRS